MPSKQWKNLDEFYAGTAQAEARSDEFDPQVNAAVQALRAEYGVDDDAEGHAPITIDGSLAEGPQSEEDLRRLLPAVGRRGFLKLTGAAAVFGLAGCWHNPPETLVPYRKQPEGATIGEARYYSTALRLGGRCLPVMAKLYDGRPIKLEGNPEDPYGEGRLSLRGQAALLDLYDPDRLRDGPRMGLNGGSGANWNDLDAAVGASLEAGGVGLIAPPLDGPAHRELLERLRQALGDRLRLAAYHPYAADEARAARGVAFGPEQAVEVSYQFAQAEVLVTLGSCPIGGGGEGLYEHVALGHQRRLRKAGPEAEKGQIIAFEPVLSQIGTVADLRQRVAMEDMALVAWGIAYRVAELLGRTDTVPKAVQKYEYQEAVGRVGEQHPALDAAEFKNSVEFAAQALAAKAGKSLVYVGGASHNTAASRQLFLAANYLNWLLGNEGKTVLTQQKTWALAPSTAHTRELLSAAAAGELKTLILWDANVAYSLHGAAEQLAAARERGCLVVSLSERLDESAALADWVAPTSHALESWGDGEPRPGMLVLQQAVITRLWDNRQAQQSLLAFAAAAGFEGFSREIAEIASPERSVVSRVPLYVPAVAGVLAWKDLVTQVWQGQVLESSATAATARTFWKAALARGFVTVPVSGPGAPAGFDTGAVTKLRAAEGAILSLVLSASRTLGDGSQANNTWLQETPDPISKVTWDNYLAVSITDARKFGLAKDSVVSLTVEGQTLPRVPVQIQPGQKSGTLELFLGWGRAESVGAVARDGGLGQAINAFLLTADGRRWGIPCAIEAVTGSYELATTQHHHSMDGRDIVLAEPMEIHRKDADGRIRKASAHQLWHNGTGAINQGVGADHQYGENLNLWGQTHVYPGRRWGMTIDLSACDGCSACVVACVAENNVPMVGREEVRRGREMHWLRIDRYYSTPLAGSEFTKDDDYNESILIEREDPEFLIAFHQPMLCQHCGHAPCEEVCPPMATMHDREGLNLQIYNRCIGTRFCANNCPYKVRRFNYYEYSRLRKGPNTKSPFERVVRNVVVEGSTTSQAELGGWNAPLALMLNPAVTVRSKGIMEKCTFCVQRTRDIRYIEKRTGDAYDDSDRTLTTACAQTCPTGAITFGDVNDPFSQVSQSRDANPHHYEVLDVVLNTRPAISYLKAVRNAPATGAEIQAFTGGGPGDHENDHDGHDHGDHAGHDHAAGSRNPQTEGKA